METEYIHEPPFTICIAKEDGVRAIGISKCMFKDEYDKNIGIEIAGKRAIRTLEKKKKYLPITTRLAG